MWEYLTLSSIELIPIERLNELGQERWELIQMVYEPSFFSGGEQKGGFHYFFKRRT